MAAAGTPPPTPVLPPATRAVLTAAVMAATVMVVLDSTIANVALPHMQSSLSATQESISWVLTAYILATAVAIPATGWLSDRLGRRGFFTIATLGFTLSSALCGISGSLTMMVAARVFQGVFGAFLAPLAQTALYEIQPPEKHASAMTLFGMAVMIGPIAGPTLGGFLTDRFDWRWVFFINVPIGIVTGALLWGLLPPRPVVSRRFDLLGFSLLAVALCALQLMLDRGTQKDWFNSTEIWIEAAVAAATGWMFVIHLLTARQPLIPRRLLADRNYATAIALIMITGGVLFAGGVLIAPMLQKLLGYPVFDAGLLIAPRGAGTMIGMLVAARLVRKIDVRAPVICGIVLVAWSLHLQTGFDLQMDGRLVAVSGLIQGIGLGFVVMPINLVAIMGLSPELRTEAAAIYNLSRNMGGSIAISITTALVASNVQTSHADLGANLTSVTLPFIEGGIIERMGLQAERVLAFLDLEVNRQALMISYIDVFWVMMWACILISPFALLLRAPAAGSGDEPIVME